MINENDILKRVLLEIKSKIDSKNTFDLILEQESTDCGKPPNNQTVPLTMNQITKFQKYVWEVVEKNLQPVKGTCDGNGKNCSYDSSLCKTKPCKKLQTVDGFWGGAGSKTATAWQKHGTVYKEKNPCWWVHDNEIGRQLRGQEIPTTMSQVKNFQRWVWMDYEKFPENDKTKRKSILCSTPCTYAQAVDGYWGDSNSNTAKTWNNDKIRQLYKKDNSDWYTNTVYDKRIAQNEERIIWVRKNFIFTEETPSGYNGYSSIPNVNDWLVKNAQLIYKRSEEDAKKIILPNYGWDVNPTLFPIPKKYAESDFINFYPEEEKAKVKEVEQELFDTQNIDKWEVSDRLGQGFGGAMGQFDISQYQQTGIKRSPYQKQEDLTKKVQDLKNPWVKSAEKWNTKMDVVKNQISSKCQRPMKFSFRNLSGGNNIDYYLSYYSLCKYAGGLWVYDTPSETICGCRYMGTKNGLKFDPESGEYYSATIVLKTNDGKTYVNEVHDFAQEMAWLTPGGKEDQIYGDGKIGVHDVMTVVEIGLVIAGSVASGGLATLLIGASALVGIADSIIYFTEGDKYMGTMMLAINLIGIDEVVALAKWGGNLIKSWTKESLEVIAKKQLTKGVLSSSEKLILSEVQQFIYKNQFALAANMQYKMAYNFVTEGLVQTATKQKWGWEMFFKSFYKIGKMTTKGIPGMLLKIGGVAIGADVLYLMMFGRDFNRVNSSFGPMFDLLYTNLGLTNEQKREKLKKEEALNAWQTLQENLKKNAQEYLSPDVTTEILKFDPSKSLTFEEMEQRAKMASESLIQKPQVNSPKEKELKYKESITLSNLENNGSTISLGMSGSPVTEINNLLIRVGYKDIENVSLFDYLTQYYISQFQLDNNLPITGQVDNLTYITLKSYKSNNFCERIEQLKTEGWVQINYIKKNALKSQSKQDKIIELECNNKTIMLYNENYEVKKDVRSIGSSPILRTAVDNPQNLDLEEQVLRIKGIIKQL
jgi:peptidoglycan hydrolase-like protein with peptidoglycan-binding domain